MYAIIESGGKQYKIEEGQEISVECLEAEVGSTVEIDRILMLVDGESVEIGAPVVKGAVAKCTVVKHGKGPKVIVFKFKRRKGYRRKNGHRQGFTTLKIDKIQKEKSA